MITSSATRLAGGWARELKLAPLDATAVAHICRHVLGASVRDVAGPGQWQPPADARTVARDLLCEAAYESMPGVGTAGPTPAGCVERSRAAARLGELCWARYGLLCYGTDVDPARALSEVDSLFGRMLPLVAAPRHGSTARCSPTRPGTAQERDGSAHTSLTDVITRAID